MKNIINSIMCCIFISFSHNAYSSENDNLEVYETFFVKMGGKEQYDKVVEIYMSQFELAFSESLKSAVKVYLKNVSPEAKEKIMVLIDKGAKNFTTEFSAEMPKIMPYDTLVKDVYVPIYAKHFSPQEIREILAFYDSPTGRKFKLSSTIIMQEQMSIINQKFSYRLGEIGSKIGAKEGAKIDEELAKIFGQ